MNVWYKHIFFPLRFSWLPISFCQNITSKFRNSLIDVREFTSAVPIIYQVDRLRDGKSFATRRVDAIQKGNVIFTLLASFQVYTL